MSNIHGGILSSNGILKVKDEPEHLLVLVHGILARLVFAKKALRSQHNTATKISLRFVITFIARN